MTDVPAMTLRLTRITMPAQPTTNCLIKTLQGRRVLIVEDDPRVRSALSELLAASEGFCVVGVAATARDALDAGDWLDVALVDVLLPDLEDGLLGYPRAGRRWPSCGCAQRVGGRPGGVAGRRRHDLLREGQPSGRPSRRAAPVNPVAGGKLQARCARVWWVEWEVEGRTGGCGARRRTPRCRSRTIARRHRGRDGRPPLRVRQSGGVSHHGLLAGGAAGAAGLPRQLPGARAPGDARALRRAALRGDRPVDIDAPASGRHRARDHLVQHVLRNRRAAARRRDLPRCHRGPRSRTQRRRLRPDRCATGGARPAPERSLGPRRTRRLRYHEPSPVPSASPATRETFRPGLRPASRRRSETSPSPRGCASRTCPDGDVVMSGRVAVVPDAKTRWLTGPRPDIGATLQDLDWQVGVHVPSVLGRGGHRCPRRLPPVDRQRPDRGRARLLHRSRRPGGGGRHQ